MFRKILFGGVAGVAGAYGSAVVYAKTTKGVCESDRDLKGRTVLVTGGNCGIGLETARDLAARNAKVILACRSRDKGEEAARDIIQSTGNPDVVVRELDLSSLRSVRTFAKELMASEKRLDVLVNNAGVMMLPEDGRSEDGLEMVMATNHFGPFLLTNLLLPLLKDSAPSRIVNVSSVVHEWAKLDVDALEKEEQRKDGRCGMRKGMKLYGRSKLANVLFTRELSERLGDSGVTANALHPGAVKTNLQRHMKSKGQSCMSTLSEPLLKTAKEGAQTSIYVAVAPELDGVSGKYFSDCKEKDLKKHALDAEAAKKLWDYSQRVTNIGQSS